MKTPPLPSLTKAEEEIMQIIWQPGAIWHWIIDTDPGIGGAN